MPDEKTNIFFGRDQVCVSGVAGRRQLCVRLGVFNFLMAEHYVNRHKSCHRICWFMHIKFIIHGQRIPCAFEIIRSRHTHTRVQSKL